MKINPPLSAAVDIVNNVLILRGVEDDGKPVVAHIPYGDSNEFIGWLLSIFQWSEESSNTSKVILADTFDAGLHRQDDKEYLSFRFKSQTLNLTFALPVIGIAPDRIAAMQRHLENFIIELSSSKDEIGH